MSNSEQQWLQTLQRGLAALQINLTEHQQQLLIRYLAEFNKWNKAYNLSAIRDPQQMISRHLLDSLSVVPWFQSASGQTAKNVIDVGTGGGLPGIPLAIVFPERQFTLLDSAGKKTRFLFHVKTQLGLANVTVENRRVEQYQPAVLFDAVISRAFASLQDMIGGCRHLLVDEGLFLAMKGIFPEDELQPVQALVNLEETHPLSVPDSEGERHLLVLRPRNPAA
ncbi:16S rRNA (guanine(527)-N(7))-methyltransferase RsmG [Cellvibrio polysaccharolyticus]|uniref:Ribosomal RNA small subunit methyltransferase G n=1 Tax=Cellvibrio polysaccharolyticus TaxID=2082724 RepID=A0A928YSU9_9GAMM|nr:16S rRNA (guanine(527)-N(7))-methyltransferase RsmG [Cellvibrio polysaccharolyticus]MBE8715680.1 16S rRNA (guanine(527)-N(7))-methyltransferase RsmG [Cellvibrio polysaccharolyticus]